MSDVTFSEYTESMRPMFVKLAEAVRENGVEAEYEHLSEVIGAPSLDDLIGPKESCGELRVPYRYTVVHTGYVTLHVEDANRWANGDASEDEAFSEYEDEIRQLVEDDVARGNSDIDSNEIEPHPSDYVSFEQYCD